MARVDVIMPQMGESIAEGTLSRWLKKVGDEIKRDEPIFEISTDKVDAEIPAPTMCEANTQPKTTPARAPPKHSRHSATVGGTVATQSRP